MKKLITIAIVVFAAMSTAFSAKAIGEPNPAGTKIVGIMGGIDPFYSSLGIGGLGYFDYVLLDGVGHFTVGGQAGYEFFTGFKYSAFSLAPRVTYGFNLTDQFELHVGAAVGYYFGKYLKGFYHGEFVGINYYFSDAMGLTAQLGYAACSPALNVGVSFKF